MYTLEKSNGEVACPDRVRYPFSAMGVGDNLFIHDFKKAGVPLERLDVWMAAAEWESLLNRRGTTWRQLDAGLQALVTDAARAAALMQSQPSLIKRPVVEWASGEVTIGFDEPVWARLATRC